MMNKTTQEPAASTVNNTAQPSVEASISTQKSSLKDFMTMTTDQQCEFKDSETGNSGTVYVSNGKMRGDFISDVNGKQAASHMINDGTTAFIWMDDQATGFKTNLEAIEKMSGQTGVSQTVDINKPVDFTCSSWTVDQAKFAVPVEIRFSDMSQMMEDAMKRMPSTMPTSPVASGNSQVACAACDSLEGEAVTQCKTALKCN